MSDSGHHSNPLYSTWWNIVQRCENPEAISYPRYGARGVDVCQEWHDLRKFTDYVDAVLGPRPEGCSIDRVDNDRGYEPGNVRWATAGEQVWKQEQTKMTPEMCMVGLLRYRAGESVKLMAAELGIHSGTFYKGLRRANGGLLK